MEEKNKKKGLDDYSVKPFDAALLRQSRDGWDAQLKAWSDDLLPSDFHRIIDWAETHMDYDNGEDGLAYGVFGPHSSSADAIMEVVYTKSGNKWLKMLNLFLSPDLLSGFIRSDKELDTARLTAVYAAAIVGTVRLTGVHPSKTVKLYGRSGTLLTFLKGIAAYLQEHSVAKDVTVTINGRWLVFQSR